MDTRELKTRRAISNAFLALRLQKPLERITIKELCEEAEISKATFYLHYKDIYDLSDTLQQKTIVEIISHVTNPRDMVDDPCKSSKEMIDGFYANRSMINILFSGSQFYRLPEMIETQIKDILFSEMPELKDNAYANIRITYQLMGTFYAFYKYENEFGFDECFKAVNRIHKLFESDIKR